MAADSNNRQRNLIIQLRKRNRKEKRWSKGLLKKQSEEIHYKGNFEGNLGLSLNFTPPPKKKKKKYIYIYIYIGHKVDK